MSKTSIPVRILRFYAEGFRSMTIGKTLWMIILIKLFVMFAILKAFFLPSFLGKFGSPSDKQEYVAGELVDRAAPAEE
ncbi:MAG: DUF4492 domain-containing protein [Prevotellaceae bacterium]|nr:DUF4492 domain-containing protein [Prevotellaceae bacterium]